jgi:hypothetical protein
MTEPVHRPLSEEEFETFFEPPMEDVTETAEVPMDISPYVDSVGAELGDIVPDDVTFVYRHPNGRWEHVIIDTCAEDVHLVLVVDRDDWSIVGHHLLNLRKKYGLSDH